MTPLLEQFFILFTIRNECYLESLGALEFTVSMETGEVLAAILTPPYICHPLGIYYPYLGSALWQGNAGIEMPSPFLLSHFSPFSRYFLFPVARFFSVGPLEVDKF